MPKSLHDEGATPDVDWKVLLDLAHDVSEGNDTVVARMESASRDIGEFVRKFIDEEPFWAGHFGYSFDSKSPEAPLLCFESILEVSGYLAFVGCRYPVDEILGAFNYAAGKIGLHQISGAEAAEIAATSSDNQPADTPFEQVVASLDAACRTRDRRLLGWDNGSEDYGWFVVTHDCFAEWSDTVVHDYVKTYDATARWG